MKIESLHIYFSVNVFSTEADRARAWNLERFLVFAERRKMTVYVGCNCKTPIFSLAFGFSLRIDVICPIGTWNIT